MTTGYKVCETLAEKVPFSRATKEIGDVWTQASVFAASPLSRAPDATLAS